MASTMPPVPAKDDVNATWKYLEAGVDKIMTNLRGGMDMKTYMGLYTAIHNFCTAQKAVAGSSFHAANNRGGAHLLGEDLYQHLIEYLKAHLADVQTESKQHVDEALLTFYIKEWNRYTTAGQYNNHLFRYLNRHWVKREMDEGKKHIYDIYTLHLVRWKEDLFTGTQESVMRSVLKLVEKQRNGETIEQSHIKSIVDSFVSLGLDEADSSKSTLDVYKEHFENPFLAATAQYYDNESKQFLAENSVVEYMKKAEARLEEEKERVPLYLLNEIMSPLMRTCEQSLITNHSQALREEFQILLNNDQQDDLGRMYKLLARIPEGLDPLRTQFETHVRKAGLNAVDKLAQEGDSLEPKTYVEALLEVHTKYQDLVNKAFNGESEFVRSLDNACREFVNRNKICKSGSNKSPELLAKYTDTLLKRSSAKMSEEDDMEKLLTQIMTVFKYIEDKDVFQKFYSRMLAKRLVQTTSASDDAETSMISKLKEACGFEYTNKLQRMFQDMQISKDLNTAYKEWQSNNLDEADLKTNVDASYHILGTGFWPLNPPTTPFTPPQLIVQTYDRFARFYNHKHQGRKLTWLWQLCKGEVKANYCKVAQLKTSPTFQVSTYQMAIMLLFNDSDTVSYDEMAEATKLNKETLDPSLGVFIKAKVLLAQPEGAKPESGTTYKLNTGFKTKKVKMNLNIGIKSEQKAEAEDTHKTIEEDRKLLMQSAIVRIMKSRKKMKHQQLVSETIQQIKNRFMPRIPDIKKCIDILLEKEYLERLEGDELGYLA
ncbi:Cullin-domain-containing protein [Cucurbitaria berberidis CBS 394.84]|uniref:Cullin-1 n=1 Tax=Cucurbitaria berberidis CBS 394.84 TaxID=1168544 RepID=A0A9P4LDB0_9PLEO|nr:Cullin-domain-containing protein [Cucurbitaria berberidis CBS 394.84]KAF1850628.1 Cullin-domain-containing protein [Cucurbitaria berberidis CBS 394.84]